MSNSQSKTRSLFGRPNHVLTPISVFSSRRYIVKYFVRILTLVIAVFIINSPTAIADNPGETQILGPKFFDALQRTKAMQQTNTERNSLMWEIDGDAFCTHTPPETIENGFQFNPNQRWSRSATNRGPLSQGDPMTLTWSFIPDGSQAGNAGFSCGVTGETAGAASDLIAFLDGIYGVVNGGSNLTTRPWFGVFQAAFDNWGRLNGVNYIYEPNDDGANAAGSGLSGNLGVRGDLRIGGHFIDGESGPNVLACNFFANSGDMIIDTGNPSFYGPNPRDPQSRGFRNVLEHEHGHGLSFNHVCPTNRTKLMEPSVTGAFLGAQEDDILAANRGYGDRDEFPSQNDTSATATSLGGVANNSSVNRAQISIDGNSDQDFYSFTAPPNSRATVTVTPTGSSYLNGPQNRNGSCSAGTNFNSLIENNLGVELRGQSGSNILATANSRPAGTNERIANVSLSEGSGTYFVRVFGNRDRAQLYDLTIELNDVSTPPTEPEDDGCSSFVIRSNDGDTAVVCL